jgi:hypothetical protein
MKSLVLALVLGGHFLHALQSPVQPKNSFTALSAEKTATARLKRVSNLADWSKQNEVK